MKTWLAAILLTLCMGATAAHADTPNLDALQKQAAVSLEQLNYAHLEELSRQLLAGAQRLGDERQEAYARLYLGMVELVNSQGGQQAADYFTEALRLGDKVGNDTLLSLALNSMAIYEASTNMNLYLAQRYFLNSLEHADRCGYMRHKGTVYANLSIIARQQRDSTGIRYAMNCYEFGLANDRPHLVYQGAFNTAAFHHMGHRNDEALRWLNISLDVQREHGYAPDPSIFVLSSAIHADMGHADEALHMAREAVSTAADKMTSLLPEALLQLADVCHGQRRYREADEALHEALSAADKYKVYTSVVDICELLARNYEAQGNSAMAFSYMRRAKDSLSVISQRDKQHLVEERQVVYDLQAQEQEARLRRQQLHSQRIISATLAALLAVLVALLAIVAVNMRRRNRLYKNIVRQNTEAISRENELHERIAALTAAPAPSHSPIDREKAQQLYDRLTRLMEDEQVYRDQQLGRESLSEMLGSNRTYLSQIVAEKSGMNVAQFINHYRIREAVRILSDRSQVDYPLKQLYADLGFSSLSNFYKLFQKSVGMSPSAYRKSLIEVKSEK